MADAKQETGANSELEALRSAMRLAMSDASLQTLLVYLSKGLPRGYYVGQGTLPHELHSLLGIDEEDERFLLEGASAPAYLRHKVHAWIAETLRKRELEEAEDKERTFCRGRIAALVPLAFGSADDALECFADMGDIGVVHAMRGRVRDVEPYVELSALRKACAVLDERAQERGKRVDWVDPETGGVVPQTEDATNWCYTLQRKLRADTYGLLMSNAQAREKERKPEA